MDIVFQQDGASPHWAVITWMTHLMTTGAVEVDQLCGLQILQTSHHQDFFLWGFVKNDCVFTATHGH